jgi:hypothetical protein
MLYIMETKALFAFAFQLFYSADKFKSKKQKQTVKNKTDFLNVEKQASKEMNQKLKSSPRVVFSDFCCTEKLNIYLKTNT